MFDLREKVARLVDQDGYWQRLDACNHALDTVAMTDEQRRQLTKVRDDEHRATAESSAIASAILQALSEALLSEEAVTAGARGLTGARWEVGHRIVQGEKLGAKETARIEAHATLAAVLSVVTGKVVGRDQGGADG